MRALDLRWTSADQHIHSHFSSGPRTIEQTPDDLALLLLASGTDVGEALVWGREGRVSAQWFNGQVESPASVPFPNTHLQWGIETSRLPGTHNGHLIMLNVPAQYEGAPTISTTEVNYPGQGFHLPNFDFIHAAGGAVLHTHIVGWRPGVFTLPEHECPREVIFDAALKKIDGLGINFRRTSEKDNNVWLWYQLLNAGFHIAPSTGTDWPVGTSPPGTYQTVVGTDPALPFTYQNYIDAFRNGVVFVRQGRSIWGQRPDDLYLTVEGQVMGADIVVPASQSSVAVEVNYRSDFARTLELIQDGVVVRTINVTPSLDPQTYTTDLALSGSSWIAARMVLYDIDAVPPISPSALAGDHQLESHTAAVFALKGGEAVRVMTPTEALLWKNYVDLWFEWGQQPHPTPSDPPPFSLGGNLQDVTDHVDHAKAVWQRIADGTNPASGFQQFRLASYEVDERARRATIKITRIGGWHGSVTLNYATRDDTAMVGEDYLAVSGSVTFAHGDTQDVEIDIPILDDGLIEGDETITIDITPASPTADLSIGPATTNLVIKDDNGAMAFDIAPGLVGQPNTFTVDRAPANDFVFYLIGTQKGSVPIDFLCPGLTLNITDPIVLGGTQANAQGRAQITLSVPRTVAGVPLLFQALDVQQCQKSNLLPKTFR